MSFWCVGDVEGVGKANCFGDRKSIYTGRISLIVPSPGER